MTHVGKWLRSRALLQPVGTEARLSDSLDRTGWWHAHSVSAAVCELAVKDAYGPDRTTLAVPGLVEAMRKYFGADGVDRIPQEAGEVLVWAALGQLTDSHDGRHVFDALLEMSVQRRFAYRRQGGDIAAFASTVVARDGMDDVSVEAAEALIRSLGEKVSLCGISLDLAVRIAVACFLQAVADLSLSTDQIDALVLSAEQLAWSRGHRPLQAI